MIEQIGYDTEENLGAQFDLSIGDGRRQMCLAATRRAAEEQPERRFFGISTAAFKRLGEEALILIPELTAADGQEIEKRSIGQGADLTASAQSIAHLALAARARKSPAKIGMAKRHITPHEPEILADRTRRLGLRLLGAVADARLEPWSDARDGVAQALHA